MTLSTLQKSGSVSLITGAILLTIYSICNFTLLPLRTLRTDFVGAVLNPHWIMIAVIAFFGVLFMMFGFTAVYSKLYRETGGIGIAGYICIEIAYLMQLCKVSWEIFLYPVIAGNTSTAFLLAQSVIKNSPQVAFFRMSAMFSIFIGTTLFCIALFISKSFPKSAGALVFTGAILYGLGPMLSAPVAIGGIAIFSLGCLQTGIRLMSSKDSAVTP